LWRLHYGPEKGRRVNNPYWVDVTLTLRVGKLGRDEFLDPVSGRVGRRTVKRKRNVWVKVVELNQYLTSSAPELCRSSLG